MSLNKIAVIAVTALVLLPILLISTVVMVVSAPMLGTNTGTCTLTSTPPAQVVSYQPDQITNAATIVAVGRQLQVPPQGWVVAIATALQESGLRNLDYGDRDSLGLFQQRPSQGWGTPAQILDPTYSATAFYQHLLALPDWQRLSVNDAAQAVQRSGFPDAYAKHEPAARALAGAVHDATCAPSPGTHSATDARACSHLQTADPRALIAVTYACTQLGKPYVWGG